MKIRKSFLALALAVLLLLSGCSAAGSGDGNNNNINELDQSNTVQPVSDYALENIDVKDAHDVSFNYAGSQKIPNSQFFDKAELSQGYKSLTEEAQRECYKEMLENVYYISITPENDMYDVLEVRMWGVELSEAQIRQVIVAFSLDNPHVFWLDNKFGYSNTTGSTVLQLYSFLSAEEVREYSEKLAESIDEMLQGVSENTIEFMREQYVHSWLLDRCEYAENVSKISDDFLSFTSYGAIVNGKAVCEGYTRAMQLLLASVGIESLPVIGNGNDGLHMWNCVKIENDWYYLDPTWNDTGRGNGFDYFNITTEQLLYDHTIMPLFSQLTEEQVCGTDDGVADSFNIMVPVCSNTEQNYYVKNSITINSLDSTCRRSIEAWLRAAQPRSLGSMNLLIGTELDYNQALDALFYSGDYIFFECIDVVNAELMSNFIDRNNVSISKKPNLRVVTVYLQYTDEE